jgi:LPS O-antigen subunit length determinant protein (WzzB/FepE family)
MILMTTSFFGSFIGFNARNYAFLGVIFLIIFAIAVILTFRSWHKDDEAFLARELDRSKQAYTNDINRMLGEIEREKLVRINQYLDDTKKDIVQQLDVRLRDLMNMKGRDLEQQKNDLRESMRNIDHRLRKLQGYTQQVNKLKQASAELVTSCKRALTESLHER